MIIAILLLLLFVFKNSWSPFWWVRWLVLFGVLSPFAPHLLELVVIYLFSIWGGLLFFTLRAPTLASWGAVNQLPSTIVSPFRASPEDFMFDHCCRKVTFGFIHRRSLYMLKKIYILILLEKLLKCIGLFIIFFLFYFSFMLLIVYVRHIGMLLQSHPRLNCEGFWLIIIIA